MFDLCLFSRCWDIIENTDGFWWIIKAPILLSICVRTTSLLLAQRGGAYFQPPSYKRLICPSVNQPAVSTGDRCPLSGQQTLLKGPLCYGVGAAPPYACRWRSMLSLMRTVCKAALSSSVSLRKTNKTTQKLSS